MSARAVLFALLAAAGVALVAVVLLLQSPAEDEAAPDRDARAAGAETDAADVALSPAEKERARAAAAPARPGRVAIAEGSAAPAALPRATGAAHARGRVLDAFAAPVPGVGVADFRRASEILARSAPDGSFDARVEAGETRLVAVAAEWVTVRAAAVGSGRTAVEPLLVVAPSIAISGRVTDAAGRPLERARVQVDIPPEAFAAFPHPLDASALHGVSTASGPDGAFELKAAPSLEGARLATLLDGYEPDRRESPLATTSGLVIRLAPLADRGLVLEGAVVHRDGSPAPGAIVRFGSSQTTADAAGRFRLEIPGTIHPETYLVAALEGHQAALLPEYGRVLAEAGPRPAAVRLVLGPPSLSIEGRVQESDGRPLAGWIVALVDGTAVSRNEIPAVTAERLSSGGAYPAVSDASGAFRIGGLQDREYSLQAMSTHELLRILSPPVRAGRKDVVLALAPDARIPRLAGRVVARDGQGIGNVRVSLSIVVERNASGSSSLSGLSVLTGPDGSFELPNAPRLPVQIRLAGDPILPTTQDLDLTRLERPIEIEAVRRCRFRVEGVTSDGSRMEVGMLDAGGNPLMLWTFEADSTTSSLRADVVGGGTGVLGVSEDARSFVIYRDGEPQLTTSVSLAPDEVTVVRPGG